MKLILPFIFCLFTLVSHAQQPPQSLSVLADKPQAPAFSLQDINGDTHQLSDYAGKPVIVNFWATWCPPCREEMPSMQRAWQQIQGSVAMLAINVGETEDKVFPFLGSYPVDFPILFDTDSAVLKAWPVMGLPTTFVLDPQGRIVYRAIGGREWDDADILQKIKALSP
ncbi:TlpA family protein disulfide reductase [Ectothiorhodospiraceae bacterium BW-2]|nr:TlpA family protein disulfide reductase [Ectothiorhodospiraceae bacterium BW-2]